MGTGLGMGTGTGRACSWHCAQAQPSPAAPPELFTARAALSSRAGSAVAKKGHGDSAEEAQKGVFLIWYHR